MKPLNRKTFVFFCLFFCQIFILPKAEAVFVSWSGSSRVELFYKDQANHYADFWVALKPKIHINDGFSFQTRFDLLALDSSESPAHIGRSLVNHSGLFSQRGYAFLDSSSSDSFFPFFQPTQFYFDYQSEFFKVRVGRAPYHFGLGASYFATDSPFDFWMSVPDQISVFLVYNQFYLQPSLFYKNSENKKDLSALLEGGIEEKDWEVAFLYEYKRDKATHSFIEAYGIYKQKNWNLSSSLTYLLQSENSFALALEAFYKLSFKTPIDLKLQAGALNKEARFHPQYVLNHFPQDRFLHNQIAQNSISSSSPQNEEEINRLSAIQNSIYVSPLFSAFFFEESLQMTPQVLIAYFLQEEELRYDFYLSGKYKAKDYLFFNIQAGAVYKKAWDLALLAQATVSF